MVVGGFGAKQTVGDTLMVCHSLSDNDPRDALGLGLESILGVLVGRSMGVAPT